MVPEISLANRFKKVQKTAEEAHNSDTGNHLCSFLTDFQDCARFPKYRNAKVAALDI